MNITRRLHLTVSPLVREGEEIVAQVNATNVIDLTIEISAPDTVLISTPHQIVLGSGSYQHTAVWLVKHVQDGATAMVEVTASAGDLVQKGLCRILG